MWIIRWWKYHLKLIIFFFINNASWSLLGYNSLTMFKRLILVFILISIFAPQTHAFEVSGWIPYWKVSQGTKDAKKHINELTTLHPFGFTVKKDGTLHDPMNLKKSSWKNLFKLAKEKGVLVIPTVTWADKASIHNILSNESKRKKHIKSIVSHVEKGGFDGVDIDYENKDTETKDSFSTFLIDLNEELGDKMLVCTVEPRTPPEDLYKVVPNPLKRANDYKVIIEVCDRIQIMTYDQQRADLTLNEARSGLPYIPLSDIDWVEKVMRYTIDVEGVPKEKLMMGIPTYGHEWEVTVEPNWFKSYKKLWSLNPSYAEDTSKEYKIKPTRNTGDELSFSYVPKKSDLKKIKNMNVPKSTKSGDLISAKALAYANKTGESYKFNLVWWSDAVAIENKIKLAKDIGILGVAIFKIDGGEDQGFWDYLK
jgi:spore germination protein YaaH